MIYSFRYRVRNILGSSIDYSPILTVRTAQNPGQVTTVAFTITNQFMVRVQWEAPDNGGNPITSYKILFKTSDGASMEPLLSYCNGSASNILLQKYCDIPMSTFRAAPLNLVYNDLIVATVEAANSIGSGQASDPNSYGVYIQTEPVTPPTPPTVLSYDEYSILV